MEYTAKINHNAYKPETRVISDKPAVKVGQWWKWNEDCPMPHPACAVFEVTSIEEGKRYWRTRYLDGDLGYACLGYIPSYATLILDPDWPIEVGDRFEDECDNGIVTVLTKSETSHRFYCECSKTGNRGHPNAYFLESELLEMRRLPRLDHVADASKKVDPSHNENIKCPICGSKNSDNWPLDITGEIHEGGCQMCWEKQSSEEWWKMIDQLPEESSVVQPEAPSVVFAADYESLKKLFHALERGINTETWEDHRDCLEDKETLVLGNPAPIREKDKRIAELEAERADDQQYQKTINELFDNHPQGFIDNHVSNGTGGWYTPEPAMRWVNDHYEDYVAKGKRIAELEAEENVSFQLSQKQERKINHLKKTIRKHEATIGHLNNRIMKMTNKEVSE